MGESCAGRCRGKTLPLGRYDRSRQGQFPRRSVNKECEGNISLSKLSAEWLRTVRYGGGRLGMGARLGQPVVLRDVSGQFTRWSARRLVARCPRWQLARVRHAHVVVQSSSQGAVRHLLLRDRVSRRMLDVMVPSAFSRKKTRKPKTCLRCCSL